MNQPKYQYYYSNWSLPQFPSPDSETYGAKSDIQNPENPQNYNRYAYCLNNPMKYTDPSGYNFGQPEMTIDGVPFYGNSTWFMRHNMSNIHKIEYNGNTLWDSEKNERIYFNSRKGEMGAWMESYSCKNNGYRNYIIGKPTNNDLKVTMNEFSVELTWVGFSTWDFMKYGKFEKTTFYQEKSFFRKMHDGDGFGHDPANTGETTRQGWTVAIATTAAVATLGASLEMAAVGATLYDWGLAALSFTSSVNDMGTDRNNEGLLQQNISDPFYKNVITNAQIGIGVLSFGNSIRNMPTLITNGQWYGIMSGGLDGGSATRSIYYYKK